jgi:hypothetical protein
MNSLLKFIGYKPSKNDREALGCIFLLGSLSAALIGIFVLFIYVPAVWKARRDSARFDSVLSNLNVDRVEFLSWDRTNSITGLEAKKFVPSLHRTNRVSHIDSTKQQLKWVRLLSGTNQVLLSLGDDGTWQFGEYGFRTRSR